MEIHANLVLPLLLLITKITGNNTTATATGYHHGTRGVGVLGGGESEGLLCPRLIS